MEIEEIKKCMILEGYRGSTTHGTYIPNSDPDSIDDIDTMGIFIPPLKYYWGLHNIEGSEIMEGKYDRVYYEIRKFFRLLLKGNPNVVAMLWLRPEEYILKTELGEELVKNRDLFISKQAFKSFAGYANGQMKRITHFSFQGYMGKKRKRLVTKYGFDVKNASHLIRLLNMCIDFLKTGEYVVYRPERKMLIEIKTGKWTLDRVKTKADQLFYVAEQEYEKCKLPAKPRFQEAEKLLVNLISAYQKGWIK